MCEKIYGNNRNYPINSFVLDRKRIKKIGEETYPKGKNKRTQATCDIKKLKNTDLSKFLKVNQEKPKVKPTTNNKDQKESSLNLK